MRDDYDLDFGMEKSNDIPLVEEASDLVGWVSLPIVALLFFGFMKVVNFVTFGVAEFLLGEKGTSSKATIGTAFFLIFLFQATAMFLLGRWVGRISTTTKKSADVLTVTLSETLSHAEQEERYISSILSKIQATEHIPEASYSPTKLKWEELTSDLENLKGGRNGVGR